MICIFLFLLASFFTTPGLAASLSTHNVASVELSPSERSDVVLAAKIVMSDFWMTTNIMSENEPLTTMLTNDGFSLVSLTSKVDIEKLRIPVIHEVFKNYIKDIIQRTAKDEKITLEKRLEYARLAHTVMVFAFEAAQFNVILPVNQARIVLEFIHRFCNQHASRYPKVFNRLFGQVLGNADTFSKFYESMIKHFDPNRDPIPIITPGLTEDYSIRLVQRRWIRPHYEKIFENLDPVEDRELFSFHTYTIICSIISFPEIDEFIDIFTAIFPHIEQYSLFKLKLFPQILMEAIPNGLQSNSVFFDMVIITVLNQELISELDDQLSYIRFADILNTLLRTPSPISNKLRSIIESLPKELADKVEMINGHFHKYELMRNRFESYAAISFQFIELSGNNLKTLVAEIEEVIIYYPIFSSLITKKKMEDDFNSIASNLKQAVLSSLKDADIPQLNFDRFLAFFSLLKLLSLNPYRRIDYILVVLEFFAKTIKTIPEGSSDFINTINTLKVLLKSLILTKNHFSLTFHYKYLRTVFSVSLGAELAFFEMNCHLLEILRASDFNVDALRFIEIICDELDIPFAPIISLFMSQQEIEIGQMGRKQKQFYETIFNRDHLTRTQKLMVQCVL